MPAVATPQTRRNQPATGGAQIAPAPLPGESSARYVDRCMRMLKGSTDQKNAACLMAWSRSGRDSDLDRIARTKFPPSKFRRVSNRPCFVEHSRTRVVHDPANGQPREVEEKYDRYALEAICDRLNERIRDTGDFAPLTAGHTPSEEARDKGVAMPDVLGYAGPYRLGIVGNRNPRYAIFCDEYHHIEDVKRLDKLQRRSPEVWLEENMGDRFFDPIACLGAETPRLDMGLTQFCRAADGRRVEKYSALAVSPSGSNTFIPSFDTGERRKLSKNAAGDQPMAISPEDVKQIVDAFEQLPWVQWVKDQMSNGPGAGDAGMPGADAAAGGDMGMPPPDAGAGDAGAPGADMGADMAGGDAAGMPPPGEPDQNRAMYECGDDDKDMMAKYASGECGDDELMSHMQGKREAYQASAGSAEDSGVEVPSPNATVAADGVAAYSRGGDMAVRYHRLEKEHAALRARVAKIDSERTAHYRRGKLIERQGEGYVFDLEDEIKNTADLTAAQFERHVNGTIQKYEKAPVGMGALLTPPLDPGTREKAKYAAERRDKIQARVLREREKGNNVSWEEAAEQIDSGKS